MVHVGGGVRVGGIQSAGRRPATGGAAGSRSAERPGQHAAAGLRLLAGLEDLGQHEVIVELVVHVEGERLNDGFLRPADVERPDQFDARPRRCVDGLLEQVGGGELGVVLGDVQHRLHALVREVNPDLHASQPVADVGVQSDQAGAFGQRDARALGPRGAAALERHLAAGPRALDPQLDLVLGLGEVQAQAGAVTDLDARVVVRPPAVLDHDFDRRAAAQPLAGAVRQQHRVVAAQPLTEELGAARCGPHPRGLGLVLVAERVVGDLDLDLELFGRRFVRTVHPGRHPVDDAGVPGPELVAGDPGVLLELDGEALALEGGLLAGRDDRLVGRFQHQVGDAEHPFLLRELRRGRQVAARSLRTAALHPGDDDVDLALAHAPRVAEVVVAGIGGPRRHPAGEQLFFDRHRPGAGAGLRVVAVRRQVDVVRRRPLRVVAGHAVAAQDGAHVVGEVDVRRDSDVGRGGIGDDSGQRERCQGDSGRRGRNAPSSDSRPPEDRRSSCDAGGASTRHQGSRRLFASHRPSPE